MPDKKIHLDKVAAELRNVAASQARKAQQLMEYADSLTSGDVDMNVALGDQFAGPMLATDVLAKVDEFTRPVSPWSVQRAVAVALANAQAGRAVAEGS